MLQGCKTCVLLTIESRIYPVLDLFKYLKKRGRTHITLPPVPKSSPKTYIPHAFTHEELIRFFTACDNIKPRKGILSTIQRITLPVFFRLLYSSGMRTTEAIRLKRDDVNLESGVVSIKSGKGYDQHFVVLHDTMLLLMHIYNDRISDILPNREYFFPTLDDKAHSPAWVTYHFRVLWKSCNSSKAIPYELRHNYAIENINSWNHQGFTVHDKLLALSKSMGHKQVESTMAYYSLTPGISDIIESADAEMYEFLIPNTQYEKD
jgi:integrase